MKKNIITTWSGGKDSCFAVYKAIQEGYIITCLVNTISSEFNRVGLHGIQDVLIQEQAKAIGIPLVQKAVVGVNYQAEFKEVLGSKKSGAKGVVFGDIFLDECKNRNERISRELGLFALEPLWGIKSADIQKLENIDSCGENGEYHTFVTNGPLFKKKIVITQTAKILRNGYWFLDIQKYKVLSKD